jgi:hypothetical protein
VGRTHQHRRDLSRGTHGLIKLALALKDRPARLLQGIDGTDVDERKMRHDGPKTTNTKVTILRPWIRAPCSGGLICGCTRELTRRLHQPCEHGHTRRRVYPAVTWREHGCTVCTGWYLCYSGGLFVAVDVLSAHFMCWLAKHRPDLVGLKTWLPQRTLSIGTVE